MTDPSLDMADTFMQNAAMFGRFWNEFSTKMAAAGVTFTPGAAPPEAAREVRSAMFKAMAEASDEFMRSPQFQAMMRQSLDMVIQFRRQLNEWLGAMHHEMQGVSRQDVDQLMEVMNHLERRTSDGFDRICHRLDELNRRLEALEAAPKNGSSGRKQAAPRRRTKGES